MDKYYYLISQLPTLTFENPPPFDTGTFLELCRSGMSEKDFLYLRQANMDDCLVRDQAHPLIKRCQEFEYALRNELALWRRAQKDKRTDIRPGRMIASVVGEGNPLDKEINLLRLRWEFLDDISLGHYFDEGALIVYYLKLQLLERKSGFNKDRGREEFERLCRVTL